MNAIIKHVKRFPQYVSKGLLAQKITQFLGSIRIVIHPYYLVREEFNAEKFSRIEDKFKDYNFVQIKEDDMNELDRFDGTMTTKEQLIERLSKGHLCFGLKYQNKIIAFNWCNPFTIHHHISINRKLNEQEAYLYDAQTKFDFRGRGLVLFLRYKTYLALQKLGKNTFYSCSDYFNKPAINFKKKLDANFLLVGIDVGIRGLFVKGLILKRFKNKYESNKALASSTSKAAN